MNYQYYNRNPDNYKINDCVTRAISFALNLNYYDVIKMLRLNAQCLSCDSLNVECYEKLLDNDFKLPHYIAYKKKVKEVAKDFSNNTLIIRTNGHLTVSKNGIIYDTFDCTNEKVTDFWIAK